MTERSVSIQQAYFLALASLPVLAVYAVVQTTVGLVIGPEYPNLKLVIEPYLLLLGLILHVQWRRVDLLFRCNEVARPGWIITADCASFMTTFWAVWTLAQAFFQL